MNDLKKSACDVIVLLSQVRGDDLDSLLSRNPGIDIIIDGSRRERFATQRTHGSAVVLNAGGRGDQICWLDLRVSRDGEVVASQGYPLVIDSTIPRDPEFREALEAFGKRLRHAPTVREDRLRRQLRSPKGEYYLGADICARCHEPEYEMWKTSDHAKGLESLTITFDQGNRECLPCHVTGHAKRWGYRANGRRDLAGVQCEACHLKGSLHDMSRSSSADARAMCVHCHDEENSPEFDFDVYMKKIKHW